MSDASPAHRDTASRPDPGWLASIWGWPATLTAWSALAVALLALAERSFWFDEAMLGVAVLDTPLWPPMPMTRYEQATPYLHFVISKLLLALPGPPDQLLRLPGMIAFAAALVYFLGIMRGRTQRLAMLLFVGTIPTLLYLATDFKAYIFEWALGMVLLGAWVRLDDPRPQPRNRHQRIYAITALSSLVLGYSIAFLIVAIAGVEIARRLEAGSTPRAQLRSRWTGFHGAWLVLAVLAMVLLWHPSTELQFSNWRESYDAGLLSKHLLAPGTWLRLPAGIKGALGSGHLVTLAGLITAGFVMSRSARGERTGRWTVGRQRGLLVFGCSLVLMLLTSVAGVYSLQYARHMVFLLAPLILWLADCAPPSTPRGGTVISVVACTLVFAALCLRDDVKYPFVVQQTRNVLDSLSAGRGPLFVFVGAEPAYEWYRRTLDPSLPAPLGRFNRVSAPRISPDLLEQNIEKMRHEPGAFSSFYALQFANRSQDYSRWLADSVASRARSRLFFSQYGAFGQDDYWHQRFLDNLPSRCRAHELAHATGVLIDQVNCTVD